jgi:Ca-activated chloride channel family protein
MEFGNPQYLKVLFLLPLLVMLFFYGAKQREKELLRFSGSSMRDQLAPGGSWRKNMFKSTLKTAGIALMILAIARPQFGSQLVKIEREGIDLVIALDTSLSMLAEDMKPNRLERAKHEIQDFVGGLKGDRVGLVAFAGDAFVLCPLTVDYNAALMFTQTADVDIVSKQGTTLDEAIETSMSLFPESGESDHVIILVTDGESHTGDPVKLAQKAADRGIRIYTIGIGNPSGELIPLRGTDGGVEAYKKDPQGETVLTRLDEKTLRSIAQVSGGKYLPATREGLELKVLYREISGLEQKAIEGEFVERKTDRFPLFLAFSFLLLGLETVITGRGSMRPRRKALHTGAFGAVALLLFVGVAPSVSAKSIDRGRVKSGNQYFESKDYEKALVMYREALRDTTQYVNMSEGVFYNEANTLHMLERYKEALAKYHASFSEDSLHAGQMMYNRANTLMKTGQIDDAIESYVQSLQYLPDDSDARYNLELALKRRDQQQQQQQQQQQDADQQNEQNDPDEQNQDSQQQDQQQGNNQQSNPQDQAPQDPDSSQVNPPTEPDSMMSQPKEIESIHLTREDALRILRLLEEQERELQRARRKAAIKRSSKGKDW